MKYLFVILCCLLIVSSCFAIVPAVDKAHKASYQIGQSIISGKEICSATAIGPQALLTATHCEMPSDDLYVNGLREPVKIVGRIRDGFDHTIYLVEGHTFADYVEVNLNDPLEISEDIFTFGNPEEWRDIYQKGYIAGIQRDSSIEAALGAGEPDTYLLAIQSFGGESGAGIFNSSGQLVLVLSSYVYQEADSHTYRIAFGAGLKLKFKQEDIDKAKAFVPQAPQGRVAK